MKFKNLNWLFGIVIVLLIAVALSLSSRFAQTTFADPALRLPAGPVGFNPASVGQQADTGEAIQPVVVNLKDIPAGVYDPDNMYDRWLRGEIDPRENEYRKGELIAAELKAEAMSLPASLAVQIATSGPGLKAPVPDVAFDSMDYNECCGGGGNVPPDPEMSAGPNHVIAAVNVAFEIYDKSGNSLAGPTTLDSLLGAAGGGCTSTFDPNTVYDEETDRFIIAADGNGTDYCIAVSQTPDPTGAYNVYRVPAQPVGGEFHDYPHTGVGDSYIVVGGNQFGGSIPGGFEGRVWALDKAVMYAGGALTPITASTGGIEGTPQPLHLHGFNQGTWPAFGATHYFATDPYDGCTLNIWQWNIPAAPSIVSTMDLCVATGVTAGMPVDFPQSGGSPIQANDFRMRGFEYRNGSGWIADGISCNPGGGTVDCARWNEVDLTGTPSLVQAGVYASTGEYRTFPDLAVNQCADMALGYTKSSTGMFPSIWYTGRESGDPLGVLQAEAQLKAGEIAYIAFDGSPYRWGDYTGMTIDPDGSTFWYLGEYSKITGNPNGRWGTYIGSFSYPNCSGGSNPDIILTKTVGTDPSVCATTDVITVTQGTDVTYCYSVENTGDVTLNVHDLDDSELGSILSGFPYALSPGASAFLTQTTNILATTVNTATWTAYNPAGYSYDDTYPYNFIDISTTGTALGLTDDSEANVTMPFQFTYFGVTSDLVRIGNNGGLLFNATTGDIAVTNAALPNATVPLGILPFWDDIDADTGNVYYETQGSAPNQMFIVQWHDRPHFSNTPGHTTFQLILFEGSNEILFQYADVDFGNATYDWGASATVGLNENASSANQYSFNTPSLTNSMAILWTPSVPANASSSDTALVNVLVPDIAVLPSEIIANQAITTVMTYSLTIDNLGTGLLDWAVFEENSTAPVLPATPIGDPALSAAVAAETIGASAPSSSPTDQPSAVWQAPTDILYDNGPLVNCAGCGSGGADESQLQSALGMTVYGFGHQFTANNRVADDFTITDPGGWVIDTITFFAYQTGSGTTSTITAVNLQIWDGPPNAGGTIIFGDTTTNRMISTGFSGIYRVQDITSGDTARPIMANLVNVGGLYLPPGTYWLDWQTDGTLASGPWAPPITINGQTTTGNGLQSLAGVWGALTDVGPQGLPFIVDGTVSGAVCTAPSDIPWAVVSPISGTTNAGNSSTLDVTFDTTGLTEGNTYTGTLCITSNDLDTPLVAVPLTLTVVAQTYGVNVSGDMAASALPGETVTYTLSVTNTGNTPDTYDVTVASVWTGTQSDTSITLGAGASTTIWVTVDVPAGALAGDSDVATVTVTSQADATATDSADLTTTAEAAYSVTLSADQASSGAAGETVSYVVTITNTGNTTDTFDLSEAGVWAVNLSVTSVTLAAGESTTFTVDVTIDAGATEGDSDVTTITATSQSDATATDSTDLTTTAVIEGYYIYLPIVVQAP